MSKKKIRPASKWAGGQFYCLDLILPVLHRGMELIGRDHVYVESFGGMASVLLNKIPSPVEIYNDINPRIVRFFRVLRERPDELRHQLSLTPYSREEFEEPQAATTDEVELARRDFVMWRQSFGGTGKGWSCSRSRSRRGMADVVSGFLSSIDENLPDVIARFRCVQLENRPALQVIREYDSPKTIHYFDPQFYSAGRKSKGDLYEYANPDPDAAKNEEEGHRNLAAAIKNLRGKWMISGYTCPLYEELFGEYNCASVTKANHQAGGSSKGDVKPHLWYNF